MHTSCPHAQAAQAVSSFLRKRCVGLGYAALSCKIVQCKTHQVRKGSAMARQRLLILRDSWELTRPHSLRITAFGVLKAASVRIGTGASQLAPQSSGLRAMAPMAPRNCLQRQHHICNIDSVAPSACLASVNILLSLLLSTCSVRHSLTLATAFFNPPKTTSQKD